ncbi:protein FAM13A isoform X2 [Polypterus senegalus]|uniref:protein FAM13A isoform X2 n=1 Tax=Polypterus senegalus TaxID=55291 RepID=UPI001966C1BA|nr:protein FAM13A isoform X2 [Polypterus senegalus]
MGAGAITMCNNKAAVRLKEDMKKIVQLPLVKPKELRHRKLFGVGLLELNQQGLMRDGIPAVVHSLVTYLKENGLQQEGLFRVNGNVKVVNQLRQKYESGEEVDLAQDGDVCSVASLLKLFLRELPGGLIPTAMQPSLKELSEGPSDEEQLKQDLKEFMRTLPNDHYNLLKYLCGFLNDVEKECKHNRMNVHNLATVFGPTLLYVSSGLEGMKEQGICNKIMARLIDGYGAIFEEMPEDRSQNICSVIMVKEVCTDVPQQDKSLDSSNPEMPIPAPRKKKEETCNPLQEAKATNERNYETVIPVPRKRKEETCNPLQEAKATNEQNYETVIPVPRKRKVVKSKNLGAITTLPRPEPSTEVPQIGIRIQEKAQRTEEMELLEKACLIPAGEEPQSSSQEDDRPMSPFYMSGQVSTLGNKPASEDLLERTIRSAVEQHLFDVHSSEDSESGTPVSPAGTARQRRRQLKEQDEARRHRDMEDLNKENIPSADDNQQAFQDGDKKQRDSSGAFIEENVKLKRQKSTSKLSELHENQDGSLIMEGFGASRFQERPRHENEDCLLDERKQVQLYDDSVLFSWSSAMKIQEVQSSCETVRAPRGQELDVCGDGPLPEVPRLDLSDLTEDNNWEDPVPAYPSWQRDNVDNDEARLSPQAGGRLIRQLLDEESDPMLSPRFYAFGQSQQYLEDTEVPPSPPNAHSFMRRRSSSLGSCEDDREELTSAQLSKKIQNLKKKIRKFEEKFEEERKYRPSHSDKATNPEVLKWMNELAKLRKQLKEVKLKISEEDLPPQTRQRSNTLPKSFGSQLDKETERKAETTEKAPKPTVESTLETVQKKLQEKRGEAKRPEDIKDMTREQIAAEKVALQKALLYYESIHGRPVMKSERLVMKPLYDRYRLVKQILCRASTIPVIGSPSSKRRSPLLQPIIEGETASFFEDIKEEEEDGSDDENGSRTSFVVTMKPDFAVRSFLDQLDEEVDGFISPVDEKSQSKNSLDMRLSNLHSATMPELVEHFQEAREDKKRLRKKLRDFEDKFFRQNGRNVQKEDRTPMADEYNEYKHIKAKLRLLEVLISKRDSVRM